MSATIPPAREGPAVKTRTVRGSDCNAVPGADRLVQGVGTARPAAEIVRHPNPESFA